MNKREEKNIILRNNAIDFIHCQWGKDCKENALIDIGSELFESTAKKLFEELTKNKKINKKPFIFRTGGQSGSGKTTQLAPSIKQITNNNFIDISVRIFAKSHPHYDELLKEFGESLIREKTNGFALLMLFRIVELLMKNKYNILFEVTILNIDFEKYLFKMAKKNKYNIHIHVLSVPKTKSDSWTEKRRIFSKLENNRVVLKSSSDFFYDILPVTLSKLIKLKIWSKNDKIFLWSGFNLNPLISGKIYNNIKFIELFYCYRNNDNFNDVDEKTLLDNKIKWFEGYYAKSL